MRQNRDVVPIPDDAVALNSKEVLTSRETAAYMGVSLSHLYKLTMLHLIPHYKPTGKICFFDRHEVEEWMKSNPVATDSVVRGKAQVMCMKGGSPSRGTPLLATP